MSNDDKHPFESRNDKIPEETENLIKKPEHVLQNHETENLSVLIKSTKELSKTSIDESLKLIEEVEEKQTEINNLKDDQILLERNKIQIDIQKNQELIINKYKDSNNKLKLDLVNLQTKVEDLNNSNTKFLINNDELIKTISRYIEHNKNLQLSLNELKKIHSEYSKTKSQINKMTEQIKFYQNDNSRLSSELINIQKKYETIKMNFDITDKEKNDIFKQIQELNNSLSNNIVGTPFVKEKIIEESINSKVLNDIADNNLKDKKIMTSENKNLDDEIKNIFK